MQIERARSRPGALHIDVLQVVFDQFTDPWRAIDMRNDLQEKVRRFKRGFYRREVGRLVCIPAFFTPNLPAFWGAQIPLGADRAGFYSTAALRETLAELVDFSIINKRTPRLAVGAANVQTGMMHYFDSRQSEITTEQIMASGALPPAFPAVYTDGEFYWDGGVLSNTPIEVIFDDKPRRNSLIFGVQLWNAKGPVPLITLGSAQPSEGYSILEP